MDNNKFLYDVIIIGAGPAGLSSSLYTSRARLKTLVIESASLPAQAAITDRIENYPGFPDGIKGSELIERFRKQSESAGAEFTIAEAERIQESDKGGHKTYQVITKEGKKYRSPAVVIASGAKSRKLGVKGEDKFTGRGVSFCAVCDGVFYENKNIVLVGGGNAAIEEALFLTKFAKKITIVHRRDRLRAVKILQERVLANKKTELVLNSQILEILGNNTPQAVRVKNNATGDITDLPCDGVFIFVGYTPNTGFLKGFLELDEKGYITTDEDMKTDKKGIFACGDCRKKSLFQIVTACADGAVAAFSAQQYVERLRGTAYD